MERSDMNQKNLLDVDWSQIPAPSDDGAAAHLVGMTIPPLSLLATDDTSVMLSALSGRTVVFGYPRTGEPGKIGLVDAEQRIPDRDGLAAASAVPGAVRREAGADARARPADHAGGGADHDQAAGDDHRQRAHYACVLPR